MHRHLTGSTSRRGLLQEAGAALAFASRFRSPPALGAETGEYRLTAAPARSVLLGADGPEVDIWAYNGHTPGPILPVRQGTPARILVSNALDQDTTVHWHGVRLPNAMDGVPGLTQPPIKPGESFTYEFTPPDAGTFWYHSHANSLEQLGRGLAGAFIVEEREPAAIDRDLVWMLADWRLNRDGQLSRRFGNAMDDAMSGHVGNVVTLNGSAGTDQPVKAGERLRLRLVNSALARMMALRFEGHKPTIVAIDGQPCEPHEPEGGRLSLGPGMRTRCRHRHARRPGAELRHRRRVLRRSRLHADPSRLRQSEPVRAHPLDAPLACRAIPCPNPTSPTPNATTSSCKAE